MKINQKLAFFAGIVTLVFMTQLIVITYLIIYDARIAKFLGFGAGFICVTILLYNLTIKYIMKYINYLFKTEKNQFKNDNPNNPINLA